MTNKKLKEFATELSALLNKYDVSLDVELDGDTHGLSTNFTVADNKHPRKSHILNMYETGIDAGDLDDFIKHGN